MNSPARVIVVFVALRACASLAQTTPPSSASAKGADETVVLSPFEVTSQGRGYYSSSTMSGTRLNSKVEDLASSITVVTKEQMADFALLDINDIFLYEAGTEGTGTYTEFSVDRNGSPVDNSLNPNTANRVRGVGPANLSFGNFETSGRMPIDPSIIDAVEISRGPNSTVFGLGNAAGTVNMAPASANLGRDRSQLSLRADSFDGYRTAIDLNRVLLKNSLAVRVGATRQHDGYNLKPSGTDTSRLNTMVRYQPFRRTSISASHFYYHIKGNRPNTTPPRDAITGWIKAGMPTWDPVTFTAKINGQRVPGNFTATTLPPYFTSASIRDQSVLFIDTNGGIGYWGPGRTSSTATPEGRNQNVVVVNTVPEQIRATQPLFSSDPSVTSKAIYDWSRVNLAAMNRINETTLMTHLQLEQIFVDSERHLLAFQGGYFREAGRRDNRGLYGTAGSSGATGFLYMDVNERMVDGSANPFFLRPYIGFFNSKGVSGGPFERETYRGQLAYRLDLRKEKSLLRWLGMQQFVGYGEFKELRSRTTIWRDVMLSNHAWYPAPAGTSAEFVRPNIALNYYRYYVGDNQGYNADTAPKHFTPGAYSYRWGGWINPGAANAVANFQTEQAKLGPGFWYDSTNTWDRSLLRTTGGVVQSHLLGERIVTTFGHRKDARDQRQRGQTMFRSTPDGIVLDYGSTFTLNPADWVHAGGKTSTAGVVAKPLRWLNLHYNQSNSFQPQGYAVGLYLGPLPDPTGKGHDYGFSLNLLGGKIVLRANRYETTQINSRNGSMRIIAQRIRNLDFDSPNGNQFFNLTTRAASWTQNAAAAQGRTLTIDQINQEVARITKLDAAYFTRPESRGEQNELVAETQDVTAKGTEIELHFNPTAHWTTKFNFTHQESIDSKMSPAVTRWITERMPVWTSIIDPELNRPWWTERYNGTNSPSQFFAASVKTPYDVAVANQGKTRPQIRKFRFNLSTSYRLAGLGLENQHLKRLSVGGAVRWEDKAAIGYYGLNYAALLAANQPINELDPARPIYDQARTYVDLFASYRFRLLGKVNTSIQLNVRNVQEGGRLQAISAYPDGNANAYRIVDPRQFILSATFDL
ncbi:MAG: TonB-dependent receptor plug domain-containing protein [Opitutaceae bacterium]|nr:TonB-dependent receptor plug domain-containing protein [Opitutaceae bacterium]